VNRIGTQEKKGRKGGHKGAVEFQPQKKTKTALRSGCFRYPHTTLTKKNATVDKKAQKKTADKDKRKTTTNPVGHKPQNKENLH